jgi:hypothetical protein
MLMLISRRKIIVFHLALALLPLSANGHHSHGEFSGEPVEISGQISDLVWRNPHPAMTLQATDSSGQVHLWRVQVLGNINGLKRNGVTGKEFRVSQQISVTGQLSDYREGLLLATLAKFEDGSVTALGPEESAGGAVYRVAGADTSLTPVSETPSLFRVWTVLERTRNTDLPMTDVTRAAREAWNPVSNDAQRNCSPLGMPGAMLSPHPIQFLEQDSDIILRLEEWDATRTIHMSPEPVDVDQDAGRLGHSAGYWDGSTLVVKTNNIDYPYLDEYGTPQSSSVEIVEHFTLDEGGRHLDWQASVNDLVSFTEPFIVSTIRWEWLPGESIQPYNCQDAEDLFD